MKRVYPVVLLALTSYACLADENRLPNTIPPLIRQECANCHTLYPPGFLPVESWERIMANLEKHYGTDASLDKKSNDYIVQWLVRNAGTYKRVSSPPPSDRITNSPWFIRKHNKISATVWNNPKIKNASNCTACHIGADEGIYEDNAIRIPR